MKDQASRRNAVAAVLLAALGYFVDIYDLILFSIVRVASLRDLGVAPEKLLDDLIATGGTATAAGQLLQGAGAQVAAASFVIALPALGGVQRLRDTGIEVQSLLAF